MELIEFESLYQEIPEEACDKFEDNEIETNTCTEQELWDTPTYCDKFVVPDTVQEQKIWNKPTKCENPKTNNEDYYRVRQKPVNAPGEFPILLAPTKDEVISIQDVYKNSDLKLKVNPDGTTLVVNNVLVQGNQEILGDLTIHGETGTAFKGIVTDASDIYNLQDYKKGWYWLVEQEGRYVGENCEVGDMIYCISDFNVLYKITDFIVVQGNVEPIQNEDIDDLFNNF